MPPSRATKRKKHAEIFSLKGKKKACSGNESGERDYDTERHKLQLESALEFVLAGIVVAIAGGRPE